MRRNRMEKLFEQGRERLRQQIDIAHFFKEIGEMREIMRMKIPLNADEYAEVKEIAKFTLLDDYKKNNSKIARKVGPHELQAIEIFSKRSDAGSQRRVKIDGVTDSKAGASIKEGMSSGINFGPDNPALLRSKTLGRKKNFRLNSNFSTTSLKKK